MLVFSLKSVSATPHITCFHSMMGSEEDYETPSGLMRLLIWPIDAILFLILLPVIIIQSVASLTVAIVYVVMAKRRERKDHPEDQVRFRTLDTFLRCCGKLDSVRRSIGVFPRYGS